MNYHTFTLSNGLRVIQRPSKSEVVYCGYEINVGSRNEESENEGLAHFCEHATFKGTQRRKSWHILNYLESVGGDLNAFTNKEDTVYYAAILKENIDKAIDILTDIVFHSAYPQAELSKEIEVICDEIESYNDTPDELIYDEFENNIFKGHPIGHNILGTSERVRSFGTANARWFTNKFYRPENAIFFVDGNVSFDKIIRLLTKATSDLPPQTPLLSPVHSQLWEQKTDPTEIILNKNTHQAHVMIGNRAYSIHEDKRHVLYLLNNILGGPCMNARLNLSLREHHGLVYTVESSMVSYGDTGLWSVYFGCDQKDVNKCLKLIRKELDRLIENPMTEHQLLAAKKQIKGQIGVACDHRENFALSFGKTFLHEGTEKDIIQLFQQIDQVTPLQLQEVAQEIMGKDSISKLIYL